MIEELKLVFGRDVDLVESSGLRNPSVDGRSSRAGWRSMRPEAPDLAYVWDMLDAALAVQEFVSGRSFREYGFNRMLRGAVERHVQVIGDAASRVSEPFRLAHPEVPWRKVVAQRHVLAHEYGEIKHELLWRVATEHIPQLIGSLTPLLPEDSRPGA